MQKYALLSVYNKDGIIEFARRLLDFNFKILASGGTAKVLTEAGIEVLNVESLVGKPILGHRVVTLSREIHAGLLADPDNHEHMDELREKEIPFIGLVCCDMYPLEEAVKAADASLESVIEKTDIGGPCMIRSGVKGRRIVVTTVEDREAVLVYLANGEPNSQAFINEMCAKAEYVVARYVSISANYLSNGKYFKLPSLEKVVEIAN